jgi:hypothetical protein
MWPRRSRQPEVDPAQTGASREGPCQRSIPDSTRNGRSFQEIGAGLCLCRHSRRSWRSSGVLATQSRFCEVMAGGGKKSPGRYDPLSPTGACTGGVVCSENVSSGSGPGTGEPCYIVDPQHAPILTHGRGEPSMYAGGVKDPSRVSWSIAGTGTGGAPGRRRVAYPALRYLVPWHSAQPAASARGKPYRNDGRGCRESPRGPLLHSLTQQARSHGFSPSRPIRRTWATVSVHEHSSDAGRLTVVSPTRGEPPASLSVALSLQEVSP